MMQMKRVSCGVSLLLLILASYSCNIVVATKRCDSSRGYAPKECSDDDFCCETNGEVKCCTAAELWWVWLIIAVSFSVLIPLVIVTGVLCCVFCCCTNKRNKTVEIVRSPRSVEQSSNNADVNLATIFKQPYSNSSSYNHTYLDAPPSYSDVSKTVQKLPPPYPGT